MAQPKTFFIRLLFYIDNYTKFMMETIWIIIGTALILTGFVGSILPVLPGPPISYVGLLVLQLTPEPPFTLNFLIIWAVITGIVMILDNLIPAYGTRKFGGSAYGVWGSIAGLLVGVFFSPIGLIAGPLVGAFIGELIAGKKSDQAFRSALGSFFGFLAGTLLKIIISGLMGYYFFTNI